MQETMKLVSGLSDGYWEKDVDEFLDVLEKASAALEVLAQIQACVGGMSMESRASNTFRLRATLDHTRHELATSREKEKKAKGRK